MHRFLQPALRQAASSHLPQKNTSRAPIIVGQVCTTVKSRATLNYANCNTPFVGSLSHHRAISTTATPSVLSASLQLSPNPNNLDNAFTSKIQSYSSMSSSEQPQQSPIKTNTGIETSSGGGGSSKSIFAKLWDRYSFQGQQKRIILGERLFRSAQVRANDARWYREGRIPYEFRPRHAILTMHVWFLHKRLLADRVDPHAALLLQEELFDILWNDTRSRIRAEGVNELTVNKHLKDAQQLTFLHCTHYDHAFQEYANDDKKRFEELAAAIWIHVLNRDEEAYDDQLKRLAAYVEYQYMNIVLGVPDTYFWEGRIPWGDVPEFRGMVDNDGKKLKEIGSAVVDGLEELPEPWMRTLTDAGAAYYWNTDTNETTWKKPS